MGYKLIDGKAIAKEIRQELKLEVEELKKDKGIIPGLAVILVGDDPASQSYVRGKERAAGDVGIYSELHRMPEDTDQKELIDKVQELNNDPKIHGILCQLPLPGHLDESDVINTIRPEKDVDGFHPISVGNMHIGEECFLPCTPAGIIELLDRTGVEISGKDAVVVGRSNIVGKPVSMLLLGRHATVTICHSRTRDLAAKTAAADILVAAVGRPKMITADMVKDGAVVIDVGVNRVDKKLVGDVDFDAVKEKVSAITPVPGGVGPMTITMLLKNTIEAAKR